MLIRAAGVAEDDLGGRDEQVEDEDADQYPRDGGVPVRVGD